MGRVLAVTIRLSRVPLFSWLALSGLLASIGVSTAVTGNSVGQAIFGTAFAGLGVLLAAATLRVSARVTEDKVEVQNRIRVFHLRPDEIAEVGSRAVETPMTRANGWGQIELREVGGRRVRVVASTGLSPPRLRRFLAELQARVPTASIAVDEGIFPSVGGARRT